MTDSHKNEISMTTTIMILFFGTNLLLFLFFFLVKKRAGIADTKQKLAKAFEPNLEGLSLLTNELLCTGFLMFMTYIFENHWIYDHSQKEYSRDLFAFVILVFFIYGYYTIKPITDLSMLSREQTEEWKGWMQFIFLLYHYFHAEEVYNSIRVMITCYVWMTGFGNFSFFYIKQDYGWLRVVQMLWRLNFAVFFLVLTHGNTYILYYICPLHTFYFLLTYITMYTMNSVNHDKWKIRYKLLAVGILIYIIWDSNSGMFDALFGWLGTDSQIGATNGSLWEWYFRSSLDHWSTFFGMIFALNFPIAEQFFKIAYGYPLIITAVLFALVTVWWYNNIYVLEKLEYNLVHSYYAIIPLTSYIFFRNITPSVRSSVSMSFHDLGKTTLETYLLQHHTWLTSNAKTLLTVVPNHPWINFAITTVIFFTMSKELYRVTMTLRGMILPDDKNKSFRNIISVGVLFFILTLIASFLHNFDMATPLGCLFTCYLLYVILIFIISIFGIHLVDNEHFVYIRKYYTIGITVCVAVLSVIFVMHENQTVNSNFSVSLQQHQQDCLNVITQGKWTLNSDCISKINSPSSAYCNSKSWEWNTDNAVKSCQFHFMNKFESNMVFKNKNVIFIGDSSTRYVYHQFNHHLDNSYRIIDHTGDDKHVDLKYTSPLQNTTVKFTWAPFIINITQVISTVSSNDLIVLGDGTWDALHSHSIEKFKKDVTDLGNTIQNLAIKDKTIFILPLRIVDSQLNTDDKKKYMTEDIMQVHRNVISQSPINTAVSIVLSTSDVTIGREDSAIIDGVHYTEDVYGVISEMISNIYKMKYPVRKTVSPNGKPTGSMSDPTLGALMIVLASILLFTMDSFLGFGAFSLAIFGKHMNWEEAYGPLLRKLNGKASDSAPVHKAVTHESAIEEKAPLLEEDSKL